MTIPQDWFRPHQYSIKYDDKINVVKLISAPTTPHDKTLKVPTMPSMATETIKRSVFEIISECGCCVMVVNKLCEF